MSMFKVDEALETVNKHWYWPTDNDRELLESSVVSDEWPGPLPKGHVQVFASLPQGECFMCLFTLAQDI